MKATFGRLKSPLVPALRSSSSLDRTEELEASEPVAGMVRTTASARASVGVLSMRAS